MNLIFPYPYLTVLLQFDYVKNRDGFYRSSKFLCLSCAPKDRNGVLFFSCGTHLLHRNAVNAVA